MKFKQIFYRLFYAIKKRVVITANSKNYGFRIQKINWKNFIYNPKSFFNQGTFSFLNTRHSFDDEIDWNYSDYGKLWTFNLNYFDFLNQKEISKSDGLTLIRDFIKNDSLLKEGKESYTISLRAMNWIKFLSFHGVSENKINNQLFNHLENLKNNLEFQFLGNHYLENGFALLFGAYYFQEKSFFRTAKKILKAELEEQILNDGAHFELSPMYHKIMLHRLLDCIVLVGTNDCFEDESFLSFLREKANLMLSWLRNITYRNGNVPMVNDSTSGISPKPEELFNYCGYLKIEPINNKLSDSGYRKISTFKYELFFDIGRVGASYQPAHAHSDTFSFELYLRDCPVIVDTGISTYEKNEKRKAQRSTSSHNTVKINGEEQTDVWGGFRVGRRAFPILIHEDDHQTIATHNGYKHLGVVHKRTFSYLKNQIVIIDEVLSENETKNEGFLHFHPDIDQIEINNNLVSIKSLDLKIYFDGNNISLKKDIYDYCVGFNDTIRANKITIQFKRKVITKFIF